MTDANEPSPEDLSRETELETSLRPAGVDAGADFDFGDDGADEADPSPRVGYDVAAVSGDTEAVRPQ